MAKKFNYVVYLHRSADTKEIFYYGCGGESRAYDLYERSEKHKQIARTKGVIIEILYENLPDKRAALILEKELIIEGIKSGLRLLNEDPSIRIERSRKIGHKVGKTFVEKGIGIAAPGIQSKAGKLGGAISGLKTLKLGIGIHGMSETKRKEIGVNSSAQRWKCAECDMVTSPGNLGLHQKSSKHVGKIKL